jgi:group I intron endonuclease
MKGIYIVLNVAKNKVYIGQSTNATERMRKHKQMLKRNQHFSNELQTDWNECSEKAFIFSIVEVVEEKNKLVEREEFWTLFYKNNSTCSVYNISIGYKISEQTKAKLRISSSLRNARYWLGKKRTNATRNKLSNTHKGLQAGDKHPMWGKVGYWKDKKKNDNIRKKISKSLEGHTVSEETRIKLSLKKKGVSNVNHPLYFNVTNEVLEDLRNGMTRKEFKEKYGRTENLFKKIKREYGIESKRGTANPKHRLRFERTDEVMQDFKNGITKKEFIAKYGKSESTYKAIKKELSN